MNTKFAHNFDQHFVQQLLAKMYWILFEVSAQHKIRLFFTHNIVSSTMHNMHKNA